MGPAGALRWLVAALVRLAAVVAVVALVLAAVGPGGPLDLGGRQGSPADGGGGTPQPTLDERAASPTPPPDADGASPWDTEELVVDVRNRAAPGRNVTAATADAIAYWNDNGGYGAYPATFRLAGDGEPPDVVVWYNVTIECPAHGDAIGCAPVLEPSSRVDPPVDVQVRHDPADNRRQVRNTVVHELGHVLGIGHCEPPHWVMTSSCAEGLPPRPDATERELAWRDATLAIYVADANVTPGERAETREQVGHALDYFERDDPPPIPADVTFRRVDDPFEADIVVSFADGDDCGGTGVACYAHRGRDTDGDGAIEYYTAGTVVIRPESDVDARGWYAGWGLAHLLSPGHVPSVFVEADYRERRSRWWE